MSSSCSGPCSARIPASVSPGASATTTTLCRGWLSGEVRNEPTCGPSDGGRVGTFCRCVQPATDTTSGTSVSTGTIAKVERYQHGVEHQGSVDPRSGQGDRENHR